MKASEVKKAQKLLDSISELRRTIADKKYILVARQLPNSSVNRPLLSLTEDEVSEFIGPLFECRIAEVSRELRELGVEDDDEEVFEVTSVSSPPREIEVKIDRVASPSPVQSYRRLAPPMPEQDDSSADDDEPARPSYDERRRQDHEICNNGAIEAAARVVKHRGKRLDD